MHSEGLGDEVGQCLEGAVDDEVGGAVEGFKGVFCSKEEGSFKGDGVARVPEEEGSAVISGEEGGRNDQVLQGGWMLDGFAVPCEQGSSHFSQQPIAACCISVFLARWTVSSTFCC